MGVDQTSLDRIRNATFPSARRGYDKREVERFLARLADWLETGGGDESRSDAVKQELERVGQRTGAILAQAEESAQQIRSEAEQEAAHTRTEANAEAERTKREADAHARKARKEADAYATETRAGADADAENTRTEADREGAEAVVDAEAKAQRIVDEGNRRRRDIEAVIADLVGRREDVLADIEELSRKLESAVGEHRPAEGADPFAEPEDYDPASAEPEVGAEGEAEAAGVFDGLATADEDGADGGEAEEPKPRAEQEPEAGRGEEPEAVVEEEREGEPETEVKESSRPSKKSRRRTPRRRRVEA